MSRQYFAEPMAPIMTYDQTAITGAAEAAIWPVNPWTAFVANQLQPGQLWRLTVAGVMTTAASTPGTLTLTPRWGTTSAGTSLGASAASVTLTSNISNASWLMRLLLTCRSAGPASAGGGSAVLNGEFHCDQVGVSSLIFGGPVTTIDTTNAFGIWLGATLGSASDTMTCRQLMLEAMN